MRRLLPGLLLLLALGAHAAIDPYEFSSEVERQRYQHFIEEMRCPKCQNQNLAGSDSPIAADLRREEQADAGASQRGARQHAPARPLAEKQEAEADVEYRGHRKHDRQQAGGRGGGAVIEQREIGAEHRQAHRGEEPVRAGGLGQRLAPQQGQRHHAGARDDEAPEHGHFRRDGDADLEMHADPARAPGEDHEGVEHQVEGLEAAIRLGHGAVLAGTAGGRKRRDMMGSIVYGSPRRLRLLATTA